MFTASLMIASAQEAKFKVVPIDARFAEPLVSVRTDTMGRLFVGGRESLFVYEPGERGGYRPRQLLYTFPRESWLQDIEVRGNDLYILTQTALYLIADGVRQRADVKPLKLIWGIPRGLPERGLRALAWGPEGDLFFTVGKPEASPGWEYWTFFCQPDGTKLPYRGMGAIFRCKPDGSHLRIVAHGLPSAGRLAFDRHWNLFTTGSHAAKIMQLWHLTPHAWLGKAIGPAGGLPPMHTEPGSAAVTGTCYYDDALLPEKWRSRLLVARHGDLVSFDVTPSGAGFKATPGTPVKLKSPGVLAVGRAGRLLSAGEKLVWFTKPGDPAALPFEPYEASEATPEKLWTELSDPSWQRRYRAHIEIARRGGDLLKQANKRLLNARADDPALHHLIWLAAQSGQGSLHLLGLVGHPNAKVRVQALRALTEFPEQLQGEPIFTKALIDDDAQVRHAALSAYFSPKVVFDRAIQQAIERGPARDTDPRLRQTAALLFAGKATLKQIESLCDSADEAKRLAGVLAAGYRLALPPATKPLPSHLPLSKHASAAFDLIEYADGKVDLRDLGRTGTFTIASHWKADKQTVEQNLLFKLLRRMVDDADESVGLQAASFLVLLAD